MNNPCTHTLTIKADGEMEHKVFEGCCPDLEHLQKAVGGSIQLIPYFNTIRIDGATHKCVAFCDEEGKLSAKSLNRMAQVFWELAAPSVARHDRLVGSIVVVWGDNNLMSEL